VQRPVARYPSNDELTYVCSAGHADEAALLIDVIDEVELGVPG
jgi:hypothetical protein